MKHETRSWWYEMRERFSSFAAVVALSNQLRFFHKFSTEQNAETSQNSQSRIMSIFLCWFSTHLTASHNREEIFDLQIESDRCAAWVGSEEEWAAAATFRFRFPAINRRDFRMNKQNWRLFPLMTAVRIIFSLFILNWSLINADGGSLYCFV